ncbi:MAG: redoxin domain-containing protein [Burkholderiaceae bacterium]
MLSQAETFDLLVFYRGLHCPICAKYLLELERLAPEFASRGVQVVAISSDSQERGQLMAEKIKAAGVRVAYGLVFTPAPQWGLYISTSRGTTSIRSGRARLVQRARVLMRPDGTLAWCGAGHARCARVPGPVGRDQFAAGQDYPARGEFTGAV